MLFYLKLHFMIFLTIIPRLVIRTTWQLVTAHWLLVVLQLWFISTAADSRLVTLDLEWINTYMRLYGCCDLIFWFPENVNISVIVLRVVLSHTVCSRWESQTADQTLCCTDSWIILYTDTCSFYFRTVFNTWKSFSEINMNYRLFLFYRGLTDSCCCCCWWWWWCIEYLYLKYHA